MPIGDILDLGQNRLYRWTDISVPATASLKGVNSKPDYDYTELGLLFPENDTTETVNLVVQMDHRKALGTPIHFHFHYIQTSAAEPTFICEYRFYNNGGNVPATWTQLSTADVAEGATKAALPYTSGSLLQVGAFAFIDPPADETVSANLEIKMWRDDADVTGDVLVKYLDTHYQMDTDGSRLEFVK